MIYEGKTTRRRRKKPQGGGGIAILVLAWIIFAVAGAAYLRPDLFEGLDYHAAVETLGSAFRSAIGA